MGKLGLLAVIIWLVRVISILTQSGTCVLPLLFRLATERVMNKVGEIREYLEGQGQSHHYLDGCVVNMVKKM